MMEAMHLAVCRAAEQPLPPVKLSHDLPLWVHRIADELTCTVFVGIVNLAPATKKYHARKNGQLVGLLFRMIIFYWKDALAILEREGLNKLNPEQEKKLEDLAGWELACRHGSQMAGRPITTKKQLMKFWKQRLNLFALHVFKATWTLVKYTLNQPVEDILQFLSGVPEGFKCFLRPDAELAKTGKRTNVFLALLTYWPEVEEMRHVQPPLERPYVLAWLEKQEGKQLSPSDHAFSELCNDIELDFGLTGHPFKRVERQV